MDDYAAVAGLTYAAVEMAKQAGLPSRWAGLLALVLAALISGAVLHAPLAEWPRYGFVAGLMAAGFYSGGKALAGRKTVAE